MWTDVDAGSAAGVIVLLASAGTSAWIARKLTRAHAWHASSGIVGTLAGIGLVPFVKPGLQPDYWYQDPVAYILAVLAGALAGIAWAHVAPEALRPSRYP